MLKIFIISIAVLMALDAVIWDGQNLVLMMHAFKSALHTLTSLDWTWKET